VTGPECARFKADVSTTGRLEAHIRQDGIGIPLAREGVDLFRLDVRMWLVADHRQHHLKVRNSRFRVFTFDGKQPLFRYEYDAAMEEGHRPAAHVQFHGRHEELEQTLSAAGRATTRSSSAGTGPNVTDLHFPVGGSRFRPCLEDVLEMLILEFDIDPQPNKRAALTALADGRERWRAMQLRTVVRDDPQTAIDLLRQLGYTVEWKGTDAEPAPRTEQLRRL
jgi:hypothetical protein